MPPIAEVGGRTAGSLAAQAVVLELLPPWRQRLDSAASGTDLQVESERTAYAHGCAQRAGVTTQRRHEAAPTLSQTHANSALSSLLPKKRSVRGGPESPHHNQPSGPAKSEQRPCACDGRSPRTCRSSSPLTPGIEEWRPRRRT